MFFKPKKKLPSLQLCSHGHVVYEGFLKDIPLRESIILEKSVQFFNDPEPCHIHRSAVRVRLTEELLLELESKGDVGDCDCLLSYADFPHIDQYRLYY